jgi:LmbE family N-acetylglucosaminyl deacetylase
VTRGSGVGALLAVFAHPDDESLASGGLLALAADAGARVAVLCLTRGEAADAGANEAVRRALAEQRTRELHEAAAVLGVTDVEVLDHPDGMLPWLDRESLEADIRRSIARIAPDVVVTFGPDGLYWHPDHIAVCERTTAAVVAMTEHLPALYFVTTPPGQLRAASEAARRRGAPSWLIRGLDDPDAFGALATPPTLVVDVGRVAARKLAALACHRSQTAGGALDMLTGDEAPRLFGVEHYRRAEVGATGPTFIERFAAAPASRAAHGE